MWSFDLLGHLERQGPLDEQVGTNKIKKKFKLHKKWGQLAFPGTVRGLLDVPFPYQGGQADPHFSFPEVPNLQVLGTAGGRPLLVPLSPSRKHGCFG